MKTVLLLAAGVSVGALSVLALRPTVPPAAVGDSRAEGAGEARPMAAPPGMMADADRQIGGTRGGTTDSPEPRRKGGGSDPSGRGGAVTRMLAEREAAPSGGNPGMEVSREELAGRAAKVEFEANRRLEQWTRELNLTEAQQDQAFGILARASSAYHPALEIEGDSKAAPSSEIAGVAEGEGLTTPREVDVEGELERLIDPDQQELLVDDLADRELWWDDVVTYLEADLDATAAAAAAAAAAADAPTESDYLGDDLSDLFGN